VERALGVGTTSAHWSVPLRLWGNADGWAFDCRTPGHRRNIRFALGFLGEQGQMPNRAKPTIDEEAIEFLERTLDELVTRL
jgi:hypothetical protein